MNDQYAALAELRALHSRDQRHLSTLGLNLQLLTDDFQEPETPRERRALTRIQNCKANASGLWPSPTTSGVLAASRDLDLSPPIWARFWRRWSFLHSDRQGRQIEIKAFISADCPGAPGSRLVQASTLET